MGDDGVPTQRLRAGDPPRGPRSAFAPGEQIGAWILDAKLGGGGFGEVYAAHHHVTRAPAALKLMHAHFTTSPEMLARFEREVQVLSRLRHPSVAQIVDVGVDSHGSPFLCMEQLVGQDLQKLLTTRGRFETEAAIEILEPLCDVLSFAHGLGIVHRDLKAPNVFVCDAGGRVVLLDFGIAKLSDALAPELTASHQSLGTPGCMAPEQINGAQVDARTDIYGLGGLLFHMLTGRMPFQDPSDTMNQYLHLHARRPRASTLVPVPAAVDEVIVRAMAIEPSDRHGDVHSFMLALRAALRESPAMAKVVEYAAILVAVDDTSAGTALDEGLLADLEAVLPAAERALTDAGFSLALDLGSSALFVAPLEAAGDFVQVTIRVWDHLEARLTRDERVRLGICAHRSTATVRGNRIEAGALLRPETWGIPETLHGAWVTSAIEPTARRLR